MSSVALAHSPHRGLLPTTAHAAVASSVPALALIWNDANQYPPTAGPPPPPAGGSRHASALVPRPVAANASASAASVTDAATLPTTGW